MLSNKCQACYLQWITIDHSDQWRHVNAPCDRHYRMWVGSVRRLLEADSRFFLSSRGIHSVNSLREVGVGVKLSNNFFLMQLYLKMPLLYSTV